MKTFESYYLKAPNALIQEQFLPQGYNVTYTWQANYQVLWNIYRARKTYRLPEWRKFCKWCKTLPYFCEIFGIEKEN